MWWPAWKKDMERYQVVTASTLSSLCQLYIRKKVEDKDAEDIAKVEKGKKTKEEKNWTENNRKNWELQGEKKEAAAKGDDMMSSYKIIGDQPGGLTTNFYVHRSQNHVKYSSLAATKFEWNTSLSTIYCEGRCVLLRSCW